MDASLPAAGRPRLTLVKRVQTSWRRGLLREYRLVGALALVTALLPLAVAISPSGVPMSAFMVPLLVGSLVLGPRQLHWFVIWVLVMLLIALTMQPEIDSRGAASVGIQFLMAFIVLLSSFRRSRLGVAGAMGEAMLVDLRDRIINQGGVPTLPPGWRIESALRSAGGTPFAGDFLVATMPEPHRIEMVVVDVSGKGEQAGTRALMLSGAFGGLLGALPPEQFLPCANDYLLRQGWGEGFATAVHLTVDLRSGAYEVRSAGHPPALHRVSGSGRWSILESSGPVLGLIPDAEFVGVGGVLDHGDAVLLYTDGMVEEPQRDIELGIDRLLGEAERLLADDFTGAADRLVDTLGSRSDDRAMLVLHRD
ncbi:PP2C family protein-serine/threonine phosphatase [Nocardioides sp. zg-DK7169]|uniref:PP2C family protein-serine/threonine phosphatase n=1 Tax=Nocardioides sp. zg-DK7169 TaxID=2736600 RepID=UPI001556B6CB|nr:PP2C family protein-serine/threonine phosphatase [Nocardioides sp. zg-DK7169]NPC97737.1 serine/threonine-protein phosphatase [Nocardioides sp. zg-DK7169]